MQRSSFFNNWWGWRHSHCWQCMAYYKHIWNLWNGNTWPLYFKMGQVRMHGRRGPTPCNVSRGHSTCLAQYLPSAWQTFVEFIISQPIDWFWWYTLHLKTLTYKVQNFNPLRHSADVKAKVVTIPIPASPMLQCPSATTESVQETNPNSLKLSFSVEVWDDISTYTLNPPGIIITLCQICHQCMPPFRRTLCINFQLQIIT